ncbi:MAG: zinc metalloprotease HtpX [Candidatus Korarchaeota archaeon]|nr:zinc metalloprotease HtpX [Candidatus Korarchaeota archaeon]
MSTRIANLGRLRFEMFGTLALLIGLATLAFAALTRFVNPLAAVALAVAFNFLMWLTSPSLIELMYRARELKPSEAPWLHEALERISAESGVRKPKLVLVPLNVPNAFAYGTPISGYRVAVTEGLFSTLSPEEVEAVLAHEVGHVAHGDMQVMMLASTLPAIFYHIGRSLYYSSYLGDRDDRGQLVLAGGLAIALATVLWLVSLRLSRLREYYADAHAATVIPGGARRLQHALVKIAARSNPSLGIRAAEARPLFISDPMLPPVDPAELRRALMEKKLTVSERILGIFSTHPNIVDRLRALEDIARQLGQ